MTRLATALTVIVTWVGVPPACRAQIDGDVPTDAGTPRVTFVSPAGEVNVAVEIADDPEERAKGLMHRESLAPMAGMIFIFPDETEHPFWMKDTPIPLDMIFVDGERKVVGIIANAEPFTTTSRTIDAPSKYVVEVNGGFAATHRIETGAQVILEGIPLEVDR